MQLIGPRGPGTPGDRRVSVEEGAPEPAAPVQASAEGGAGLELLSSRGTEQVIDLTVGDTQIVMIFDEGLEL